MGKYSDIIAETQAEDAKERARAAGLTAPAVEPDAMGRAMRLADQRGLPPGVVADNLPEYDQQQQLDALGGAATASPALARWLGDPNHVALSKDDTGVLAGLGRQFNSGLLSAKETLPWLPLPQSALDLEKERQASIARGPEMRATENPAWFSELVGKFQSGWQQGRAGAAIAIDPFNPVRYSDSTAQGLGYASGDAGNAALLGTQVADAQRRAQALDVETAATTAGFQEIAAAEKTGSTGKIIGAVATNPRAVMAVVAQSLGNTAPQLALSAAMPASRVVAGVTAGSGSFAAEQGMTILDVMGDAGVETSDPAAVSAFLRNKPAMERARQKALTRGVAVGTFDALTAGFAGRLVANSRRSVVSIAGRVAGEAAMQAGGGAAGEATAQLASEGKITSQSDIILEAAAEIPTFLAEGRGQIAEARRAALNNADRFDAHQEQRSISDLVNLAAQSKTRERSASRFESLIRDMTSEGEDTIYLSAEGAQRLFQSANTEGGPDLGALVDGDALREAIATGGEVAIPLAKYATLVTPELHASVADQVRLQPGGRHDLPPVSPEEIQDAITAGLAEAQQQDARENGPAGQVYDDVVGQLLSRQDEQLARQNASVVQSVYRNLAERVGTDAWTLYQQFKIRIPGASTDVRARPRGVDIDVDPFLDALRSGKLPTDREVYGDTLASALHAAGGLRDSGGELANMDAAKARPGLVSNLAGMSLDDALVWAYQEGFITEAPTNQREGEFDGDAPDINTLLDLLAQDLGGNPVYRPGAMNAERASFRERAQALQDELDQRGVDLSQADNAAARQALGYGRRFNQAGPDEEINPDEITFETGQSDFENNASGESAASVEALNRLREEAELGRARMLIDRDGSVRQLFGVDAVDAVARPGQVIVQRNIGADEWTVLSQGSDITAERAQGIINRARGDLDSGADALFQGGDKPRGAVTFTGEAGARVFNIELLKGMDASTFMHEMGHVYLEVLNDLAAREGAPAQIVNDMATLNTWLGRKGGMPPVAPGKVRVYHGGSLSDADVGDVYFSTDPKYAEGYRDQNGGDGVYWVDVDESLLDRDLAMGEVGRNSIALSGDQAKAMAPVSDGPQPFTVDQHEQFARGFEAYLREGKAPSSALRRTFAAFKVWLTALYRSVRSLNVELTDDVRNVMDRILASDAEIEDARAGQYQGALIADAMAVGMTFEQMQDYNEAVNAARADAEATVAAEVLLAERREQLAWYNREKREVRAQVLEEVRNLPVYRAQRLLRNGKLPSGDLAPDEMRLKLSKEDLLDKYGQSFLRNLTGMYSVEGGVRSDEAAAVYGFGSGRELVESLVNAPRLADAVASETEARMKDRHPDPMTDGTLPDRAMIAAHRDRQADVMVREIRALEQHVSGRQVSQAAVIKGVARQIIQDKKLRHLQPATYRSAEAKAGREAFEAAAKQDWGTALAARRRQLLNFELFREAVRARDEAARTAKYLAKFGETKTRARLGKAGGDYLDQVDGLLDRFDFRKISDKAADRRASLATWIEVQAQKGIDVNLPPKIMDEAFTIPYREMTVADLAALRDAIRAIDHLARLKGKLLLAGEVRDAEEIDAAMAASLAAAHAARPVTTGDRSPKDKLRQAFMQGRVIQATATDMARELDGFKDQGAIWMNTVGVMRDAVNNRLNPALQQAQDELAQVYVKHYSKAEIRGFSERVPMPEVNGDLWSKSRLLGLALNWGNAGNREAILTQARGRMSPEQVNALLSKLDSRDWAFVEDVWRLIDSQWPAIADAQKRRTGLVPERVQASAFTVQTSDGKTLQIPGGYYPLKYESDSVKTMKDEADDFYNSIRTGRSAKAATRNGHTIERVGSGGRTVRLDTGVVQQHLRDVLRDVHLGDAVNYVHNVLNGQKFKEAVDSTGTQEYRQALEVWLKDAAAGEIGPRVWHERAMRAARQNFTASVLTFKVTSALLQLSGVVPTIVTIGQGHTMAGIGQYLRRPRAMTRYVREASPYMDSRLRTHIEAVQAVMDAEAGRFAAGKAASIRFGYWMIGRVQGLVDTVTWLAAEQAGMVKFENDVARARAYADDVVTRAQGSGEFIDKSPLQRGTLGDNVRQTEWIKATTALQGYMIAKGNLAYEQTRKANLRNPRQAMKWAADMVMLFSVEGLLTAALTAKLPKDDDDDGLLDDLGEFAIKDALATFFGVIPGGGVLVDQFRGYDSSGVVAGAWRAYAELAEKLTPGEDGAVDVDKGVAKAAVTAAGVTLGLPSTQINKTIDAIAARADGRDVSPYEYLTGPKKEPK